MDRVLDDEAAAAMGDQGGVEDMTLSVGEVRDALRVSPGLLKLIDGADTDSVKAGERLGVKHREGVQSEFSTHLQTELLGHSLESPQHRCSPLGLADVADRGADQVLQVGDIATGEIFTSAQERSELSHKIGLGSINLVIVVGHEAIGGHAEPLHQCGEGVYVGTITVGQAAHGRGADSHFLSKLSPGQISGPALGIQRRVERGHVEVALRHRLAPGSSWSAVQFRITIRLLQRPLLASPAMFENSNAIARFDHQASITQRAQVDARQRVVKDAIRPTARFPDQPRPSA
jgi:hypothetical protein